MSIWILINLILFVYFLMAGWQAYVIILFLTNEFNQFAIA